MHTSVSSFGTPLHELLSFHQQNLVPIHHDDVDQMIKQLLKQLSSINKKFGNHMDIKPQNILLTFEKPADYTAYKERIVRGDPIQRLPTFNIYFIDFGVAMSQSEIIYSEKMNITGRTGTTIYMAPEMLNPGRPTVVCGKSDSFSLALVFIAILQAGSSSHKYTPSFSPLFPPPEEILNDIHMCQKLNNYINFYMDNLYFAMLYSKATRLTNFCAELNVSKTFESLLERMLDLDHCTRVSASDALTSVMTSTQTCFSTTSKPKVVKTTGGSKNVVAAAPVKESRFKLFRKKIKRSFDKKCKKLKRLFKR